jgi:hypothetical protein
MGGLKSLIVSKLTSQTKAQKFDDFHLTGNTQSMGFAAYLKEDYYDENG